MSPRRGVLSAGLEDYEASVSLGGRLQCQYCDSCNDIDCRR